VPLALLLVALLLGGCAWTDKSGTHHLIVGIGFGVITTTNRPGVDVWDSHVLGAEAGPSGFGVGWMGHNRVVLDPVLASNVVVSIQARHFGVTVKNFDPYSKNTTNIQTKSVSDSKTRP
jgi:hypothetical protein